MTKMSVSLKKALSNIALNLKTLADCGLIESDAIDGILSRITTTVRLESGCEERSNMLQRPCQKTWT